MRHLKDLWRFCAARFWVLLALSIFIVLCLASMLFAFVWPNASTRRFFKGVETFINNLDDLP